MTINITENELIELKRAAEAILRFVDAKLGPKKDPIELISKNRWATVKKFLKDSGFDTKEGKRFVNDLYSLGKIDVQETTLGKTGVVLDTEIRRKEETPLNRELSFYNFVKVLQNIGFKDIPLGKRVKLGKLEKKILTEIPRLTESQFQLFLKDVHMIFPRKVTLEPSFDPYEKSIEIGREFLQKI
jgi:hypothetical protein